MKGQALEDFLADHPVLDDWERNDDLPEEAIFFVDVPSLWKMFFDVAIR